MVTLASELRLKAEKFNENKSNEDFDKEVKHLLQAAKDAAEKGRFSQSIALSNCCYVDVLLKRVIAALEDHGFKCETYTEITGERCITISW